MDRLERRACEVGRVSTREEKFNFFELFERSLTFWILRFSQLRLTCCRFPADQATLVQGLWTGGRRRGMVRVFFICFKLTEKVKLCLRRHLREGGAWTGESPSEGIVDIIDPGEGSTPLFFIIFM